MDDDDNHLESYEQIPNEIVKFYEGLIDVADNRGFNSNAARVTLVFFYC